MRIFVEKHSWPEVACRNACHWVQFCITITSKQANMIQTKTYSFTRDQYRDARGGHSRFLKITCEGCGAFLGIYQKDGPGHVRRMYIDRLHLSRIRVNKEASCPDCKRIIGTKIIYKKESRPAIRLYVDAVIKKIVSAKEARKSHT